MASISGWFRPSRDLQRLFMRSVPELFPCHFVPGLKDEGAKNVAPRGKTARCMGSECVLCDLLPREIHHLAVVQVGALRELRLLEFKSRHLEAVEELKAYGDELFGTPVFVWRDALEHGEPTMISTERPHFAPRTMLAQRIPMTAIPCARYIGKIGTREYLEARAKLPLIRDLLARQVVEPLPELEQATPAPAA